MKNTSYFGAVLINLVIVAVVGASEKDALAVLGRQVPDKPLDRVVQMVGIRGQHQPSEWRIVLRDKDQPGVFHLYMVQGKQVVRTERVEKDYRGEVPEEAVRFQDLRIDSNRVFMIADREARLAKIGFDSVNYELRCPEFSDQPVWFVDLRDVRGGTVGRIFLSATTGEVLNRIWFPSTHDIAQNAPGAGSEPAAEKGIMQRWNPFAKWR